MLDWHRYPDLDDLVANLGQAIIQRLQHAITQRGQATLAVSGGSTPVPLFHYLARSPLPWSQVKIALVDERWVPPQHTRSNTALVHQHLLTDYAQAADYISIIPDTDFPPHPADAVTAACERYQALLPFDIVLLGLGPDGHCASLFAQAQGLEQALDLNNPQPLAAIDAPASQVTGAETLRLSCTLATLVNAHWPLLMITGETKASLLTEYPARLNQPLPIDHLLTHLPQPLAVYHCP